MRNKFTVIATAGLLLICCLAVPAAFAQEKCNLQTLTGTYAIYEKGSSLFLNTTPSPFPFYAGIAAPFVNVTELTFSPNGVAEGFFWIRVGDINGGLDPVPVHVTVTEMKPDCTGKLQYTVNLPGLSAAIEERILVFDNGREFRSIPTSIQNGIDTLAWTGTGKRISKSSNPVHSCGPQIAHGTYLLTAENIVAIDPTTAVADALFIREDVSLTGDYTGTLYEKLGPVTVETAALGTVKVNPDCSFAATLRVPEFFSDVITMRGVFFNGGKEYYALAIDDPNLPPEQQGIKFSFAYGKRISQ